MNNNKKLRNLIIISLIAIIGVLIYFIITPAKITINNRNRYISVQFTAKVWNPKTKAFYRKAVKKLTSGEVLKSEYIASNDDYFLEIDGHTYYVANIRYTSSDDYGMPTEGTYPALVDAFMGITKYYKLEDSDTYHALELQMEEDALNFDNRSYTYINEEQIKKDVPIIIPKNEIVYMTIYDDGPEADNCHGFFFDITGYVYEFDCSDNNFYEVLNKYSNDPREWNRMACFYAVEKARDLYYHTTPVGYVDGNWAREIAVLALGMSFNSQWEDYDSAPADLDIPSARRTEYLTYGYALGRVRTVGEFNGSEDDKFAKYILEKIDNEMEIHYYKN